ncbi:ArsC family reductase [Aliiglaciecola sp. LCG003]|uniref:ArsC family reductase n=1 Tax=Aliiglaciecola sp. LCG003 TaxID=3053655 RepID=UPI00257383BD|nr:ArsC family reductase [Aliiglaciecola sp. LCG003]WJG07982.1 ArsC family reductase [Aliiglaciecola sp. LCG003]
MTKMFGIKNCDTIKKAKKWLEANQIDYQFHDYRVDGITSDWLIEAESKLGWQKLLNQRGTTFRQLSEEKKQNLDTQSAIALMLDAPAMIKRPVLIHNGEYHLGFKPAEYEEVFK